MADRLQHVLGRIQGLAGGRAVGTPDQALLDRFTQEGDTDAFGALVQRHGGLVWSVCRRLMAQEQDAEDVFQAAFMVLARKARSIRRKEALGPWLYRVAYHLGVKARGRQARRREREREAMAVHEERNRAGDAADLDPARRELLAVLDREVQRLPSKYRDPLILCDLQGKSHEEAARELDCPPGSMSRYLLRGRELLRDRLVGRGVSLTSAVLTAALADNASAQAPARLMQQTVVNSVQFAAGGSVPDAALPAASLARGALRSMTYTKLLIAGAGALVVSVVAWMALPAVTAVPVVENNAPKASKPKTYGPLEVRLVASKNTYEVNLGDQTPKQFRNFLEFTDGPKPKPPAIDVVLEIKNTSARPIQFWHVGDPVYIDLKLAGPDAVSIPSGLAFTANFQLPQGMKLAPGKTHTFKIPSLASGRRGLSQFTYWLTPGDYKLSATLHTGLLPAPKGVKLQYGFGPVDLTTEPVTLKVVAGKGGKIDKETPRKKSGGGNSGTSRGGQGGGFVPGSGPAVNPDGGVPVESKPAPRLPDREEADRR